MKRGPTVVSVRAQPHGVADAVTRLHQSSDRVLVVHDAKAATLYAETPPFGRPRVARRDERKATSEVPR